MTVLRSCCFAVGVLATVGAASADSVGEQLPPEQVTVRQEIARQEIIRQAELNVLRQRVSMPLDRLVQPVSLAEWQKVAHIAPQITESTAPAPQPRTQPQQVSPAVVAEDATLPKPAQPAEAASSNPFADDPAPVQTEGKIPSGKLLGIVGRALIEAAPVPSLEGLREHLPNVPIPAAGGDQPAASDDPFGSDPGSAPKDESDPFAEPAEATDTTESNETPTTPEEDPFG